MAVTDREFEQLSTTVADHELRLRTVETTAAETRGAAREAARVASRLVAAVSIVAVLLQAAVGIYFHYSHSHSSTTPPARSSRASSSSPTVAVSGR